ncbi:MAG: nickel-dependent lactate racemase [Thermoplasmata archaeon]|nr:MAG: nickel-dependent lactate racemase [Thermoplasmata archaeon]KAA0009410.1 MAG: nickel-dependent lactate racemase [Thermoplasmata archaeon]
MEISFPYGKKSITLDIPEKNLVKLVEAKEKEAENDEEIIKNAIEQNAKKLEKLKGKVAVVVDDKTRPCPTKKILPYVLEKIKAEVKIIFATGTHEPVNEKEAEELLGKEIANEYDWISHSQNAKFVDYGVTSFGTPLFFNAEFAKADAKILIGDVEYHYFAGYGGGRKSVLPGVSAEITVEANHKRMFHQNARFGVLSGNPVHEDMEEAADMVGINFCLNVVMNSKHQIVGAFAGEHKKVLRQGAKLVDEMYKVKMDGKADAAIIAADGFPHDINLYQAMKAIQTVIDVVKENGTIILIAECSQGHGSQRFYNEMEKYTCSEDIKKELLKKFIMGKHKVYYMLKASEKVKLYMITSMDENMTEHFRIEKISEEEILDKIYERHGKNAKIIVSPHASTTIVSTK